MTANPRHVGPAVPGVRLSRRVRDLLRSIVAVMLSPAMVVSRPVVSLLARHRPRARLRLAAGTHAEHERGAAHDPGAPNPAREPGRRSAGASWQPRATAPTGIGNARVSRAARAEPPFSTVRVRPAFSPRAYAQTFAALQVPPSAKLLDLTAARMLSADLFEQRAREWTAAAHAVPRLGILVSFERWVTLRDTAVAALPLPRRGIKIEVFCAWTGARARLSRARRSGTRRVGGAAPGRGHHRTPSAIYRDHLLGELEADQGIRAGAV